MHAKQLLGKENIEIVNRNETETENNAAKVINNKDKVKVEEVIIATRVSPDQFARIEELMGDEVVRYRPHSRIAHTIVSG